MASAETTICAACGEPLDVSGKSTNVVFERDIYVFVEHVDGKVIEHKTPGRLYKRHQTCPQMGRTVYEDGPKP